MSETVLEKIIEVSPQLAILLLFVVSLALLLKEYRTLRGEMKTSVDDAVNSRLGSILGNLQIESNKVSQVLTEIKKKYEDVQILSSGFESRLKEREETINSTFSNIEESLRFLQQVAPKPHDAKYSARDLGVLLGQVKTADRAVALIAEAEKDPDATSKDLEILGDEARRFRKFGLAKKLYQTASERDPENLSATVELLALTAETDPGRRGESLMAIRDIVLKTLDAKLLGRCANAYIELDRYSELQALCEQVLEVVPPDNPDLFVQAHRDLAVALQSQHRYEEAADHLRIALDKYPKDQNSLKAYIVLLQQNKEHAKALTVAQTLLSMDPANPKYCVLVARLHVDLAHNDEAVRWYEMAERLLPEGSGDREIASREKTTVLLRKELEAAG